SFPTCSHTLIGFQDYPCLCVRKTITTSIKIKAAGHAAGSGWTSPAYSPGYGSAVLPHCRLLKQDGYYYRVLLDNTIYESNLSYDDAILLIGKLVSLNRCSF
ncbi:hypothetical protein, partial [Kistimonas scapharcae]|uniref:hypothetical protein n=1 Tax=Kistimonas scapharcae TaxID=1036133 RepID=UPI0031EEDD05